MANNPGNQDKQLPGHSGRNAVSYLMIIITRYTGKHP